MWLGTIALVTVAGAQERINARVAYAEAVDALVVRGELVEPALPSALASVALIGWADLSDASLVVTVEGSDDGVPTLSSVELDGGADFDGDGDVDGRDFLVWQRGGSPAPNTHDYDLWRANFGQTAATIESEAWLGAALPELDDRVLLGPPANVELIGFEVEQDGKVRGALLWEVRTTPRGTDVVTHLWATAALEPLVDVGDVLTIHWGGPTMSIPEFYEDVVLALDSDPIATYEQSSERVLKIADWR